MPGHLNTAEEIDLGCLPSLLSAPEEGKILPRILPVYIVRTCFISGSVWLENLEAVSYPVYKQ